MRDIDAKYRGQLLAYLPLVLRRIDASGPAMFVIPEPRLGADNVQQASKRAYDLANARRVSMPELRHAALANIRRELARRGFEELEQHLPPAR